jgi:CBS domain-containing protein
VIEQVNLHGAVFRGVPATEVMTYPVASLPLESTVGEAANFLRKTRINSAPVVDRQGKLVGVLSEKDVISILPNHAAWNMPIERIMQRTFVSFEEDAPVDAICEFLSRVTVRRVFVVRDGAPIGVVTQGNLLRWYGAQVAAGRVPGEQYDLDDSHPESRERLLEGAEVIAECAAKLAKHASDSEQDPLAPVVERVHKLQDLVDALIAASAGKRVPIDLADSDSFPAGTLQYVPSTGGN